MQLPVLNHISEAAPITLKSLTAQSKHTAQFVSYFGPHRTTCSEGQL